MANCYCIKSNRGKLDGRGFLAAVAIALVLVQSVKEFLEAIAPVLVQSVKEFLAAIALALVQSVIVFLVVAAVALALVVLSTPPRRQACVPVYAVGYVRLNQ